MHEYNLNIKEGRKERREERREEGSVGEQNLQPKDVSLWHKYYFRLLILKRQKTWEIFLFTIPLTA